MKVDVEGLLSILKEDCIECNDIKKCSDCIFFYGNNGMNTRSNIKRFGINNLGKQYLYYFLQNPELNWKLPLIPEEDYLGNNKQNRKLSWEIHHEDGNHYNDNKWNQILVLNTEHRSIHNYYNHPMKNSDIAKRNSISNKNTHKQMVEDGTHHIITNHPFKNEKILEKFRNNQKKRIREGNHIFVTNNPNYKNKKILNLEKFLKSFKDKEIQITNILSKILEYSDYRSLIRAINSIIERLNLKLKIEHRGKKYHGSWYLCQEV